MGTYLFERCTSDGAGRDASPSLLEDVTRALREIDWVESFSHRAADGGDDIVTTDVVFDEQWPDIRTSNPDQVGEVFRRLGLRTIASQSAADRQQVSADDPLGIADGDDEDLESLLSFDLDDGSPTLAH